MDFRVLPLVSSEYCLGEMAGDRSKPQKPYQRVNPRAYIFSFITILSINLIYKLLEFKENENQFPSHSNALLLIFFFLKKFTI